MQAGEVFRRTAFNLLDFARGGKLNRLKKVNKQEIVNGVTDEYVERRIQAILSYAKENSPYYKEYREAGCLQDFPVMNKPAYNAAYSEFLSDEYRGKEDTLSRMSTSGSTGVPFTVLCNADKMNRVFMNFLSVMELNGFRMGMKRGEFRAWIPGKNTISKWKSFKNNLIMIDISNMGDDNLAHICDTIRKKKIQVLVAYSSALPVLASYVKRKQIDMRKWDVEMIFAMGEALSDEAFQLVKETFGVAPVRSYGNNENGFMGVQLNEEDRYTVDLYNFHIEMLKLDSDEPVESGELGRIVITDFYNRAFPMIRYDTGDTGKYVEIHDKNGRKHGYFTELYGRRGSVLYNTAGEPLCIHVFMNILFHFQGIVYQAKCIQWEKNRYELQLNADRTRIDEQAVVGAYKKYLGQDANVQVTYVDEIPVQASGKRMVCENRCPDYQ